jgi:hypothetical protein
MDLRFRKCGKGFFLAGKVFTGAFSKDFLRRPRDIFDPFSEDLGTCGNVGDFNATDPCFIIP